MGEVGKASRIAVIGAGAMGTALAVHSARAGADSVLLATDRDEAVVDVWRRGLPHPTLRMPFHHYVRCCPAKDWADELPGASIIFVAVSSAGLERVLSRAAGLGAPGAVWVMATKGWADDTLQTPSQVATAVLGDVPVVSLAGPALAAEILAGSPTGLLCASADRDARRRAAAALTSPTTAVFTTSDVAGAETSAAFKNVVAVAVGLAEGLSDRLGESAPVASYGNARAAVFARGMLDMLALAQAQGGRARDRARAGRRRGSVRHLPARPQRPLRAAAGLGRHRRRCGPLDREHGGGRDRTPSAALRLAARAGLDLPSARVVELALTEDLTGERVSDRLRDLFLTVVSGAQKPRAGSPRSY